MSEAPPALVPSPGALSADAIPRLPRGVRLKHDNIREEWVLLAPERVIRLDPVAVEVLRRCTGEATVTAIVDDLARAFAAPRERIEADVLAMLDDLSRKRLLEP